MGLVQSEERKASLQADGCEEERYPGKPGGEVWVDVFLKVCGRYRWTAKHTSSPSRSAEAWNHLLSFKGKLSVLLHFGPKKKRKDSPWQGVIWSTWSKRLFLYQSVLLQILTLPPYASADQSSAFQNLCRDGFPAPCRRAEGSEQEGDKPGHSQLLLCVGRFVSVLKPERLSWCTATSGFCKMPFFITRSLQRAATSQPVRLCGGRTTRAASLIDEQR